MVVDNIGSEAKKAKLATGTGCVVEEKVPGPGRF
jgi:hypothetical protein